MTSVAALTLLEILLKSFAILGVFALLDRALVKRIDSRTRHLLWLNAIVCLSLLPVLPALITHTAPGLATSAPWFEINASPASSAAASSTPQYAWLTTFYFLPTCWLIARLAIALLRLRGTRKLAKAVSDPATIEMLADLSAQTGIKRRVALMRSAEVDSPVSFGLLRPLIALPLSSHQWSRSMMTDVLLHELSHIKRLDWITLILARLVTAFYWINPLVWLAVQRLDEEAEHSCDAAVLLAGRSDTDYAESLLLVAQACRHSTQPHYALDLSAQKMLNRNTLKNRIHHILEEQTMNKPENNAGSRLKKSFALLLMVSTASLWAIGGTQLVSAQAPDPTQQTIDEEMFPLHQPGPIYPSRATQGGIEGWVQVKFTVTAGGYVDQHSIQVVDAQPEGIFDISAMHAISEFTFSPRIQNGSPVDVPNVQYVVRYSLDDAPEQAMP